MNDESRPEPPAQPAETPREEQRSLPHLPGHLAQQAMDGSVKAAAGYAVGKGMEKVFGGRGPDKSGSDSGPPGDQAPAETE
jgi:hypothetical protein